MIVLVSLIVLLRGFPCFHDFSHGASLHPYSLIFTLVTHIFHGSRINAAINIRRYGYKCSYAYMCACVHV